MELMRHERIASALCGGISVFVLIMAFASQERAAPHSTLFVLGFCSEGISLALAPEVLFQHVSFKQLLELKGPIRYGTAAILSVIAIVCFMLAAVFWGLSRVTL